MIRTVCGASHKILHFGRLVREEQQKESRLRSYCMRSDEQTFLVASLTDDSCYATVGMQCPAHAPCPMADLRLTSCVSAPFACTSGGGVPRKINIPPLASAFCLIFFYLHFFLSSVRSRKLIYCKLRKLKLASRGLEPNKYKYILALRDRVGAAKGQSGARGEWLLANRGKILHLHVHVLCSWAGTPIK